MGAKVTRTFEPTSWSDSPTYPWMIARKSSWRTTVLLGAKFFNELQQNQSKKWKTYDWNYIEY